MRGSVVSHYVWEETEKEILDDVFPGVFVSTLHFLLCCQFITIAKDSGHAWSLFGANIG